MSRPSRAVTKTIHTSRTVKKVTPYDHCRTARAAMALAHGRKWCEGYTDREQSLLEAIAHVAKIFVNATVIFGGNEGVLIALRALIAELGKDRYVDAARVVCWLAAPSDFTRIWDLARPANALRYAPSGKDVAIIVDKPANGPTFTY